MFTEQSHPSWGGYLECWPKGYGIWPTRLWAFPAWTSGSIYGPISLYPCTYTSVWCLSIQFLALFTALHLNNINQECCLGLPSSQLLTWLESPKTCLRALLASWALDIGRHGSKPDICTPSLMLARPRPSHIALPFGAFLTPLCWSSVPWPSAFCVTCSQALTLLKGLGPVSLALPYCL